MNIIIDVMKKQKKKDLIGVEIGVWKGTNAKNILNNLDVKKLYLIDPYLRYIDFPDGFMTKDLDERTPHKLDWSNPQEKLNEAERIAKEKLKEYKNKTIWIKKLSVYAIDEIPDEIDFVYVDGNHKYDYVKFDIVNFFKKIRKGGILCGDDYNDKCFEVKKAIDDFVEENHSLKLNTFERYWWIIK